VIPFKVAHEIDLTISSRLVDPHIPDGASLATGGLSELMINRYIDWVIDLFMLCWLFVASTALLPLLVLGSGSRVLTSEGMALLRL